MMNNSMPNTAQKNSTPILNIRHMRLTTTLATLILALIISLYAIKTLAETSNTETKRTKSRRVKSDKTQQPERLSSYSGDRPVDDSQSGFQHRRSRTGSKTPS